MSNLRNIMDVFDSMYFSEGDESSSSSSSSSSDISKGDETPYDLNRIMRQQLALLGDTANQPTPNLDVDRMLNELEEDADEEEDNHRSWMYATGVSDIPSAKVVKCSVSNCRFINEDKCIREGIVSITESGRCINYSPRDCPDPVKEFTSPIDSVEI